jgi:hypothetical protein
MAYAAVYALMLATALAARGDCPPCGPDYCHDDPRYPAKLAAKKLALSQATEHYPSDLIALMDHGGKCIASVEQAPDGFSIKEISETGTTSLAWTRDDETISRNRLLAGTILRYYKFNAERAFVCCGDKKPQDRPDWRDGVSTGQAIVCKKVGRVIQCE